MSNSTSRKKVVINVNAESDGDGYRLTVTEYPGIDAVCYDKRNIAKVAIKSVSAKHNIPVGKLVVAKVVHQ